MKVSVIPYPRGDVEPFICEESEVLTWPFLRDRDYPHATYDPGSLHRDWIPQGFIMCENHVIGLVQRYGFDYKRNALGLPQL